MCGISAILSRRGAVGLARIAAMTDLVRHRGPDDEGFAFFADDAVTTFGGPDTPADAYATAYRYAPRARLAGSVPDGARAAFGHRRLSIVDLSPAGHQPMASADGRYWITYNGEIYNHLELREELHSLGHHFASRSDTEVILAAYAQWGSQCLQRFNGMWAFVLLDTQTGNVFGARDRFGVKPLYYWSSPAGFVALASEIKQFTALPGWAPKLQGQRVYDFLQWGSSDHDTSTMFCGVEQVRGGECFELRLSELGTKLPVRRWYALTPCTFAGDMHEAADQFRALLQDSVRLRLRSDVRVGSCLSGGLDSTSIVCLANDLLKSQGSETLQRTFSACADVKRFDERDFIDTVVSARGIEAHYVTPPLSALFSTLPQLTWHQDEPFGSTSIYAQWHVFELAAAHGMKVMLDGQGADEQLAGYHPFFSARFSELLQRRQLRRLWHELRMAEQVHGRSPLRELGGLAGALVSDRTSRRLLQLRAALRRHPAAPGWLNVQRLGANPISPRLAGTGSRHPTVDELSHAQLTSTNLPMLLHWEDRDSMAHSVESRVPFLDYRLVEFVLGLPSELKISEGTTKRVLREGMRGVIPEKIRMRTDKLGFVTPEEVWLRERAPDQFRTAASRAVDVSQGILTPEVLPLLDRVIDGREPFSAWAWRVISFGAWIERFDVGAG